MKKLLLLAAFGLGLLVLVLGGALYFSGSIARTAVERGGTFALGVPTTLESLDLGLFAGRLDLGNLTVANPAGFDQPSFLQLDEAAFEVSLESLSSNLVEAPLLSLNGLHLSLERKNGRTNYQPILERLQALQGPESAPEPESDEPAPEGEQKQFVIHEVLITNVTAHLALIPQGGKLTEVKVTIPELRLQELGHGGASLPEIIGELTQALLAAVVEAGGQDLPLAMLTDLKAGLGSLEELSMDLGEGASSEIQRYGEELGGELGKQLGEGAGKELESQLKSLFD